MTRKNSNKRRKTATMSRRENKTGGPNTQDAEPSLSDLVVNKQSDDMKSAQNFGTELDMDTSDSGTTSASTKNKTESDTIDTSVPATPPDEISFATLAGPANPGIVRTRNKARLSKLPEGKSVNEVYTSLINQGFSEEKAILAIISTYDVAPNEVTETKLSSSFSNVKYFDIAPYVYLDPTEKGRDIINLAIHRARIPMSVFKTIFKDITKAHLQYGPMKSHENEEARSRYISSFFSEIICMFGSAIRNVPEGVLVSEITKKDRIEHHFYALNSVSIVFLEVKKSLMDGGRSRLNVIAQVLAESAACDYVNSTEKHWVPILGILSDGREFEFFVLDSGIQKVFSSGGIEGLNALAGKKSFVSSLKKIIEYLFDFFIMGYINGLRSFLETSNIKSIAEGNKRTSTSIWEDSLHKAKLAHVAFRKAAALAEQKKIQEAENEAENGILLLKESVDSLSHKRLEMDDISTYWDDDAIINA